MCNIMEYDRYEGGSMMVWGGNSLDGPTDLQVMTNGALSQNPHRVLGSGRKKCHMDWPAQSSDLIPI